MITFTLSILCYVFLIGGVFSYMHHVLKAPDPEAMLFASILPLGLMIVVGHLGYRTGKWMLRVE